VTADGRTIKEFGTGRIAPGTQAKWSFTWAPESEGTYQICAEVDGSRKCSATKLTVKPKPAEYPLTVEVLGAPPPWAPYPRPPQPLEGARVFVDGVLSGTTDGSGRVTIRATEGTHTVRAEKDRYSPVERLVSIPEQTFIQIALPFAG